MERRESGGKMRSEAGQLQDAVEGFRRAMLEAGLRPEEVVDTGERALPERCPVGDDRPGERSGWYVFAGTQNVRGKKHSRPDAAGQPRFKARLTPHPEKDVFYECSSFFNSQKQCRLHL